jgi:pyruvate,water dikinase
VTNYAAIPLADARVEGELGGKAVQLGAAIRAGLSVPSGVALAADTAAACCRGDPTAMATLAAIRRSLAGPLAVRSSCVGEDTAAASFAGQYETRLGVTTRAQLAAAVTAVWRSACQREAGAYRRKLGLSDSPRMAVVIQRLVQPDVAGVLFTRDPVTGADERLIEAAWGLGEAVVQGLVTPDRYRLSRGGEVLEQAPGRKEHAIRALANGSTTAEPVPPARAKALCLDSTQLAALQHLALRCEETFPGPSDIEWAIAGGILWLLQRRPVTALCDGPRRAPA